MDTNRRETTINAFFTLIRAGLWEQSSTNLKVNLDGKVNWEKVYQLAGEQSVVGLALAGLECSNIKPSQTLLLQWIGEVQLIEQNNKAMNDFIAVLIEKMQTSGIYALLVKGQGIARCYERPLWRSSGDIDLLLNDDNFRKAQILLLSESSEHSEELTEEKHQEFSIGRWIVEIHGNMPTYFSAKTDALLEEIHKKEYKEGEKRIWKHGGVDINLLSIDADILFVFTHILKHFFRGGIGLRQICDWCRLLWTYRDQIDMQLLENRLKGMGLMTEWKAFAALAVNELGYSAEYMPLYSSSQKWVRKSLKIKDYILKVGNFGHNRDTTYYKKYPYLVTKVISFYWRLRDNFRYFVIFPIDSIRVSVWMLRHGFNDLKKQAG